MIGCKSKRDDEQYDKSDKNNNKNHYCNNLAFVCIGQRGQAKMAHTSFHNTKPNTKMKRYS